MLIALHKNARTTPAVRAEIAASNEPANVLALRFGITEQTVYKWKKRDVFADRSHTAHHLQTVLTPAQETVVLHPRRPLLLPLMFGLMAQPAMAGDLEQPMKKIGFNYKQAVKADDAATMEKYIKEMKAQLDVAKGKNMPAAKKEKFLEGMTEVQTELDASLAALQAGDEAKAREHLAKVNDLKKEYHKYAKQKG